MEYNSIGKKNSGKSLKLSDKEPGDVTAYLMTLKSKDVAEGLLGWEAKYPGPACL